MTPPRAAAIVLALLIAGCSSGPRLVPLPEQYPVIETPEPPGARWFVNMGEDRADAHVLAGIPTGEGAGEYRWTSQNLSLQFTLPRAGGWTAALDFVLHPPTMRDTGPVTVSVAVNGRAVGQLRCERPGRHEFRAPVPAEAIRAGRRTVLSASVDKPWVAETDGAKLGFLLHAGGFLRP
jgi:hypothetical protein